MTPTTRRLLQHEHEPPRLQVTQGLSVRVGFIGLGGIGGKLATSLSRSDLELTIFDLRQEAMATLVSEGAEAGADPRSITEASDVIITCLPSVAASANVLESAGGVLEGMGPGKTWLEMSTTDPREVIRLGRLVAERGGAAMDCPVSGGCHRATSRNIAIFAGGPRDTFEEMLEVLVSMGRQILHTGPLGSASVLKVITNFLASANLFSLAEALVTAEAVGMDLNTTYEAIRISSGNSFVHETEGQLILNGSRDIEFTMDLVTKDMTLFQQLAQGANLSLELSPLLHTIFEDGKARFGGAEWSTNIIRRLEERTGRRVIAPGFPSQLIDDELSGPGREVTVRRSMSD